MKIIAKALLVFLGIVGAIAELMEFLLIPITFLIIGLLQQFPWQYYAITIGGYFALILVLELILKLIFHALGKKYSSRFAKKVEKIISSFSRDNSTNLPSADN